MKINAIIASITCILISQLSFAASKSSRTTKSAEMQFGLTVSSSTSITGTQSVLGLGLAGAAVGARIIANDKHHIRAEVAIPSVNPTVSLGFGFHYNYEILGNIRQGLHVGGALGMNVTDITGSTEFIANIVPLVGFHWMLQGLDRLLFSVEAGPNLRVGTPGVDFGVGPVSDLFGMSITYLF